MNQPNTKQCLQILKAQGTHEKIIRHSIVVNKIAVLIAKKFLKNNISLNLALVNAGSLLHDVKKWDEINNNTNHGTEGYKMFKHEYPRLADIIKKHMLYEILDGFDTWEQKIVYYADKRVNHDKIVSLKQRFDYLEKRYPPKDKEKRKKVYELNIELEKEIFSKIDIKPDGIR
ncbi:HDIG domain-containing protein [Candidatus Woesearchaeota archaeon]|nr:HDIG domain-containing protein [Candidatus Woesearchaeota archaeon]